VPAPRLRERATHLPTRTYQREWFGLHKCNIGIVTERTERAVNTVCAGKGRIEERHTLDTPPRDTKMA
jgi:hypothetical protein